MLIPTIEIVRESVHLLPRGEKRTVAVLRGVLAERFGEDAACPVTIRPCLVVAAPCVSCSQTPSCGQCLCYRFRIGCSARAS
jgi:hypothetical protein